MATDKKISELPLAAGINANDISVLVNNGIDYQFSISLLLQFLTSNLSTGAVINFGTVTPQNNTGKNGDLFVKTDSGQFIQKVSGSWTVVYTLSATNAADGAVLYGTGNPSSTTGKDLDTYINTVSEVFYLKTSGIWNQVFSMQTGPQGPQGNSGPKGSAGIDGKTILSGTTIPSNLIGTDGDYYMNTALWQIYGPKAAGVWGAEVALFTENSFAVITGSPEDNIALSASLNNKVDKVAGKQLTDENYTTVEKTKLANLSEHYVGYFATLASLQTTFPTGSPGQYATVDAGAGVDAKQYVWDINDSKWVLVTGPGNVLSINGQVGAVTLSTDNIGEGSTNKYFTDARVSAYADARYLKLSGGNLTGQLNGTGAAFSDRLSAGNLELSGAGFPSASGTQGSVLATRISLGSLNTTDNGGRYISVYTNNVKRWDFGVPNITEPGSNAGSDIGFVRSNDAGVVIDTPFGINRQTGKATFLHPLTVPNGATTTDAVNKGQLDLKLDLAGGNMTGDINFYTGALTGNINPLAGIGILWRKNSDYAHIYYESNSNIDGSSNLIIEGGDDRTGSGGPTEGVKFRNYDGNNMVDYFTVNPTGVTIVGSNFISYSTIGTVAALKVGDGVNHVYSDIRPGVGYQGFHNFYQGATQKWSVGINTDASFTIYNAATGRTNFNISPNGAIYIPASTTVEGKVAIISEMNSTGVFSLGQSATTNPKQLVFSSSPSSNSFIIEGVQQAIGYNQNILLQPNGGNVNIGYTTDQGYRLAVSGNVMISPANSGFSTAAFNYSSLIIPDPTSSNSTGGFTFKFENPAGSASTGKAILDVSSSNAHIYNAMLFRVNNSDIFNINSGGVKVTGTYQLSDLNTPVPTSTSPGTKGEIRWSGDFVNLCVATNQWVRAALLPW